MAPGNLRRMTDHPLRERIEDLDRSGRAGR